MKPCWIYLAEKDIGHGDWKIIGVFSSLRKAQDAFDKAEGYIWKKTDYDIWSYGQKDHPQFGNEIVCKYKIQ